MVNGATTRIVAVAFVLVAAITTWGHGYYVGRSDERVHRDTEKILALRKCNGPALIDADSGRVLCPEGSNRFNIKTK